MIDNKGDCHKTINYRKASVGNIDKGDYPIGVDCYNDVDCRSGRQKTGDLLKGTHHEGNRDTS
jgi:hypothetical protein